MLGFIDIRLLVFALLALGVQTSLDASTTSSVYTRQSRYGFQFKSTIAKSSQISSTSKELISQIIIVDQSGHGHFTMIQHAIDSIPPGNTKWIEIHIRAGIYYEKVTIPNNKPYISLVGENRYLTVITWWDGGGSRTLDYATFSVWSNNFVARNITFKNSYRADTISQAPAALIYEDKIAFYECGFIGVQDTLTDFTGRHLFQGCYIEGYIDFIWGYGQSVYHGCTINVTSGGYDDRIYGAGFITAQGRAKREDSNGFVFKYCVVVGTSFAYLGRPYQTYSRVIFYKTYLSNAVVPQGWNPSFTVGHENYVTRAEVECTGPGSDTSKRVKWGKSVTSEELNYLLNTNTFINQDYWIQNQPSPSTSFKFSTSTTTASHGIYRRFPLPGSFPFAHPRSRG